MKSYSFKAMALTSAIISQLVGSMLIGVFSGKWIDSKLQTDPLFLIMGLLIGLAFGAIGLVYLLKDQIQGD